MSPRKEKTPLLVCATCGAPATGWETVRPKVRRSACDEHATRKGRGARKKTGGTKTRGTPKRQPGGV
jgi:hypothetical protein